MNQLFTKPGRSVLVSSLVLLLTLFFTAEVSFTQVAINTDNSAPNASAMLDVKATGLGFLVPRMTSANKPVSPATGLLIYQTDVDPGFYYFDGAVWQKVGRKSDQVWNTMTGGIYYNAGNVAAGIDAHEDHGLNVKHYLGGTSAVRGMDRSGDWVYAEGMLGVLQPQLMGIPTEVYNVGVLGIKPLAGANGAAVYGWNLDGNASNYAGAFVADGAGTGINYAIYADADNANTNIAGYFKGRVQVVANNADDGAADITQTVFSSEVTHNQFYDTYAIYGSSIPQPGYGIGVYGTGGWRGVYGFNDGSTYSGTSVGVYGYSTGTAGTRYGVYGNVYNTGTQAVGVYGYASGATTNWAGYFNGATYTASLRVGSTLAATGYIVSVDGKIACEEVRVQDSGSWPDYVFDSNYELMSLDELEQSINENSHLPGIPSAQEVSEQGVKLGEMQKKLLEKVEQLTLYTIQQDKLIKDLQKEVEILKAEK